jgi:hypothetical protein
LKDAPWAFAPQRLRNELLRAHEAAKALRKTPASPEKIPDLTSKNVAEALKLFAEGMIKWSEKEWAQSAPQRAVQDSLLQKLQDGTLEACGVQFAPRQLRELEIIPDHFFRNAKVNWTEDKVTNFGVTYGVVRVQRRSPTASHTSTHKTLNVTADTSRSGLVKPSGQETGEANATPVDAQARALTPLKDHESAETRKKMGRPTVEMPLREVIRKLVATGQLRDKSRKEQFAIIRAAARAERPDCF